ncbi:hypothetical protein Tco_0098909, partial [Tanacetum coccineum]
IMKSLVKKKQKRRNSGAKTKTFEESTKTTSIRRIPEGRYGASAPAHHKKRVLINSLYGVSTAYPYAVLTAVTSEINPIRRAAKEWFTNECIGTISTWDDLVEKIVLKFYNLCEHDEKEESDDDNDPDVIDNVLEIIKIDGDLFNFDSPLCIAFEEFNHLLKVDLDLFTYDIQGFKTYDKYAQELNNKTQGNEEPWSENMVPYQLCDHICEPLLPRSQVVEKSWGDATPGLNTHEIAPFTRTEDFGRGPYANMKTNWTHDPYLGTNQILGASNIGSTRENQGYDEHMGNETPKQSVCKIRRFKMMKYSFSDNEEYIIIKEFDHLNYSKKGLDAYRELLQLTNEGWVVTTPDE